MNEDTLVAASQNKQAKQNNELNFDWQRPVSILSTNELDMAQNENFVVVVYGELRRYGFEGCTDVAGASLLLELLSVADEGYYPKIAGFFNAIIFSKQQQDIKLISDHIGSKPLYYSLLQDKLTLTDNLNLLDHSMLELNPQGIFNYCFYHCIAAPTTIYNQIYKLAAGECVTISQDGEPEAQLIYRPEYHYSKAPSAQLNERCLSLIAQAVNSHVTPQCGAFLSGGLDSSTVAGMLAKGTEQAKTFSIGFDSPQYDESAYARLTAEHFSTKHFTHVMQPDVLIDNFKQVAGYFDQPFGNSSAMAAYCCAMFAKSHGVTTLLAGDGGDEIFAGNERYAKQGVFEVFNQSPKFIQGLLEGLFCNTPLGNISLGSKAASYISQAKLGLPDRLDSYNFLNRFALDEMFCADFLAQVDPMLPVKQKRERYEQAGSDSHIERMLFLDWKFTLADNDLVKVTKMCEMAGVEVRYPLLEKELVDFSCQIKDSDKLQGQKLRHFFKGAVKGFLPDATLTKEKHGFGLPFGLWMSESDELMTLAQEALFSLSQRSIFKPEFIELALSKHQSEHAGYYGELIWILVILELWLQSRGL